jgi:NADPH:quinone reductase
MGRRMQQRGELVAHAVRFHEAGPPDVLRYEEVEVGAPGQGEVQIRQSAIGVNFADLSMRAGIFPAPLPACPGSEAAGTIVAVGPGVATFAVGDRVAYGGSAPGSYATLRNLPAAIVSRLPDSIDFETAAGMMSAGLTAGYLLRSIWPFLKAGDAILWHAAAGGVGQIAVQWAKALGLTVIGTVGTQEKVAVAKAAGCDEVLLSSDPDLTAKVRAATGGTGVAVAYDSIGKDTAEASLKSLRRRGLLVLFGAASGPPPQINAMDLVMGGSLYVTRPGLPDYLADPAERARLTEELFQQVTKGAVKIAVNHRYPLDQAAAAHRDVAGRKTTGSVVLIA